MDDQSTDFLGGKVKELFGLDYLFPYQRLVITNILEATAETEDEQSDRETLGKQIVILPTGAGKSLCFQLPAMLLEGITLVIYPILSLMADQERRLNERGFAPVVLRGGQSEEERKAIWEKLHSGQSRIIIANPEVLLTAKVKEQMEKLRHSQYKIVHIVIDEAHCVSEWGESFRPSYLEIGSIINLINPPLVTAFTATASAPVLEKIKKYIFGDLDVHQIVGNPDRSNISYCAKGCINRNLAVRDLLIQNARPAIVFCSSRPGTEKLARYLRNEFLEMEYPWYKEIRFYHAGLSKEEKSKTEKWFFDNSEAVLVSTCAYGMGVDKADVRTVIHRDCAPSVEAYLQESGRAGRDGRQSKAILLWGPESSAASAGIASVDDSSPDDNIALARCKTEPDRARLLMLLRYAKDINRCRRHSLLEMLNFNADGEVPENFCCDVCEGEASSALREEFSVLDFFRRNKRRFTVDQAVGVLTSSQIRWSQDEAEQVINYMIKTGKLKKLKHFPWKDKITFIQN